MCGQAEQRIEKSGEKLNRSNLALFAEAFHFGGDFFPEVVFYFWQGGADYQFAFLLAGEFIQEFGDMQVIPVPCQGEQETYHRLDKMRVGALFQSYAVQQAAASLPIVENATSVENTGTFDVPGRIIGVGFDIAVEPLGGADPQALFQFVFIRHYAFDFNDIYGASVTAAAILATELHAVVVVTCGVYIFVYIFYRQNICFCF
jgi:hypothetical protein